MRHSFTFLIFVLLSLSGKCPAAPSLTILAKHSQPHTHGMIQTTFIIGLSAKKAAGTSLISTHPVTIVVLGPAHPGVFAPVPAIYTNSDASLMIIQSMPYWGKKGRLGYGRSLCLVMATPHQGIKVIQDFSGQLNRLVLAHVSQWQHVSGNFHRPASDIFMGEIQGRTVYAQQYTPDPKVGLPEYITISAEVSPTGDLTFLSYSSQGF